MWGLSVGVRQHCTVLSIGQCMQDWCHQIIFVNNTKIFVTHSVTATEMILTTKWGRIHQEIQIWHVQVTWRCLAVPKLPKALLKMASCLISVISPIGHRRQLCIDLSFSYTRQRTHCLSWSHYHLLMLATVAAAVWCVMVCRDGI